MGHFAVPQKLRKHRKSTILLKKYIKKKMATKYDVKKVFLRKMAESSLGGGRREEDAPGRKESIPKGKRE